MTARPTPRVRPARPADAPVLTEIAHVAKVACDHVFVATEGATVIGFYALRDLDSGWSLEHCWVRPAWIGRGIGRLLFDDCVSEVRRRRPGTLRILSDPHAAGFYRRMGAARLGEVDASLEGSVRALPVLVLDVAPAP